MLSVTESSQRLQLQAEAAWLKIIDLYLSEARLPPSHLPLGWTGLAVCAAELSQALAKRVLWALWGR
eukprot:scaffold245570_cov47-Prasinocladus_malaysianus.AAC.1